MGAGLQTAVTSNTHTHTKTTIPPWTPTGRAAARHSQALPGSAG